MTKGITVERRFHVRKGRRGKKLLVAGRADPMPSSRVSRISRLLALAIRFDQLLRDGIVNNQAELARLGSVSRGRITQIMNLLNLAPEIQEYILFVAPVTSGCETITERNLRRISQQSFWEDQRRMWTKLSLGARAAT
jgi:hypothetical protein